MKFNEFDKMMREFEESLDQYIPEDKYMVARLDGRSFSKLTKYFEKPFSLNFHMKMLETVKALMTCGFNVKYGYTQSDEISLLFDRDEKLFNRKVRKYDSILGGTASAAFSLTCGKLAVMDCRMIPLPTKEDVCDYFLWRQEDSIRNALNCACYWALRQNGKSARAASSILDGESITSKRELLESFGLSFDELEPWKKYGSGMSWESISKAGTNPITGETHTVERKVLTANESLPTGLGYINLIQSYLD